MRLFFQFFALGLLIFIASCSKDLGPTGLSDAEIIQMIQNSDLEDISKSDLPSESQDVVDNDYFDYMNVATRQASGLGYEVALAGRGYRVGSRHEVYFNLRGRKLDPNDWGDKRGWDKDGYGREFGNKEDWRCFDLVFPLTYNMPDGSSITVESDEESNWSEIKDWYEENPELEEKPELQFPVVIFYEDESVTLSNFEELRGAYSRCEPRRGRDDHKRSRQCFTLVYPLSYTMPDGSVMEVTGDDEEGWSALKAWYEVNTGYEEVMPNLNYPVDVVFEAEEGEDFVTINSEEEMQEMKEECQDDWGFRECFTLVYPLSYTMPDGSVMEVTGDDEDGWTTLKNWYEENPGYEEVMPNLNYPVDIVFETEEGENVVTVNSEEEMELAKRDCREDWEEEGEGEEEGEDNDRECFEMVLPVTFVMPDGSLLTVSEDSDWLNVRLWYEENGDVEEEPSYQFPVDIVYETEDGNNTVTINSQDELESAEEECWEEEGEGEEEGEDNDRECFEMVLPITFVMPDGSLLTVSEENDWLNVRLWYEENGDVEEEPSYQFPVNISYETEGGYNTVTIQNQEEMEAAEEECWEDEG